MYKPTIIGLLIVLVLIIVYQFYKISEGFTTGDPIIEARAKRNEQFVDIYAHTTNGQTLYGVKILYNSNIPVLRDGQSTDTTLALNLGISPTKNYPVTNKPASMMQVGYKYYFVPSSVVRYTEGTSPLLGSFIYDGTSDSSSESVPTLPSLPPTAAAPTAAAPTAAAPTAAATAAALPIAALPTATLPSVVAPTAAAPSTIASPTVPVVPAIAPAAQPTATLIAQQTAPTSAEAAISKEKQDKANLLRDIQEIVRTELLQQQKLTTASSQPVLRAGADGNLLMSATPATAQGQELSTARDKFCPKDMNEYIRKDSIPCWNCTLDY